MGVTESMEFLLDKMKNTKTILKIGSVVLVILHAWVSSGV